jgi:hypothetical protein
MDRELPTGYLQAYHKYHGDIKGVKTLWAQLKLCREAGASLAQLQLGDPAHLPESRWNAHLEGCRT